MARVALMGAGGVGIPGTVLMFGHDHPRRIDRLIDYFGERIPFLGGSPRPRRSRRGHRATPAFHRGSSDPSSGSRTRRLS